MKARLRPCNVSYCPNLTRKKYCVKHASYDNRFRESSAKRGYGRQWAKARIGVLAEEPLCRSCKAQGVITPATEIDHIIPHRGDMGIFWNPDNWQPLCKSCHSRKTYDETKGVSD